MAVTLTLTGNSSILSADYFPPLELQGNYTCGLIGLQTYNSIPNIDSRNNMFYVSNYAIEIPDGAYEIEDLEYYIQKELDKKSKPKVSISIVANNNTLRSELLCSHNIDFSKKNTIGSLLGFDLVKLKPNILHISNTPVNIVKVNTIRVECNIVHGAYINNTRVHTLHEFFPAVAPGYKITEIPTNVIYLPLNVQRITTLTLKLIDQDGDIINLRGEKITIRLHLLPQ